MVLKIYGSLMSTCTKRVVTTLHEKQVPFEVVEVDFAAGEHKSAKYLEKHPFGKIPLLEDEDGFLVYESRAICRYIEAKYKDQGTQLIPTDLKGLAIFEQGASIELSYFGKLLARHSLSTSLCTLIFMLFISSAVYLYHYHYRSQCKYYCL